MLHTLLKQPILNSGVPYMKKVRIIVENFEEYSVNFSTWSTVYFMIDNMYFPSMDWCDATSSILEMWAYEMASFISLQKASAELFFMDGDYVAKLKSLKDTSATIQFLADGQDIIFEDIIDIVYLGRQILSAIGKFTDFYSHEKDCMNIQKLYIASDKLRISLKAAINRKKSIGE